MNCRYAKMQIWKSNGEQSPPLSSDRHIPTHEYYNTDDKRLEINNTKLCIRHWSYQKSNESLDIEERTIQYQRDKQSSKHYRKLIDWLMFNANFSDISVISWREQILLLNYIFVYKLISFENFKIVSPATFVNKLYKLLTL
jgi:hypothetical protein